MLADYGMISELVLVHCDNKIAINISKNYVKHSCTKHIDIRHHFVRELVEDEIVEIEHVAYEKQLADIFTEPMDVNNYVYLKKALCVCEL